MARVKAVRPKKARPLLLFDQLSNALKCSLIQHQVIKLMSGCDLGERFPCSNLTVVTCWRKRAASASICLKRTCETLRKHIVLLTLLFGDNVLNHRADCGLITANAGLYQGDQEVASRHRIGFHFRAIASVSIKVLFKLLHESFHDPMIARNWQCVLFDLFVDFFKDRFGDPDGDRHPAFLPVSLCHALNPQ